MANPEHLALVGRGREAIAEWRRAHPRARLNLSGAILSGANLMVTDLSSAYLRGANLRLANLTDADLSGANLTEADLSDTLLLGAKLTGANLTSAVLIRSLLQFADLSAATLAGANMSQAAIGATALGMVDMSHVQGLSTVAHERPSSVGMDTLTASLRGAGGTLTPDLAAFFRGAGVPQELLEALPGILAEVKYCTCFIAYGQPDLEFATKLCKDLEARGVSCWVYEMDATVGKRTWGEIGQRRREAEKMVVLCSVAALIRDGVLKEMEEQIDEDPEKVVPISLDDLWKEKGFKVMRGERDLKPFLLDKNYADFASLAYQEALERLLEGLKRRDASAPAPSDRPR